MHEHASLQNKGVVDISKANYLSSHIFFWKNLLIMKEALTCASQETISLEPLTHKKKPRNSPPKMTNYLVETQPSRYQFIFSLEAAHPYFNHQEHA